jgi:hypothetical protein
MLLDNGIYLGLYRQIVRVGKKKGGKLVASWYVQVNKHVKRQHFYMW